MTPLSDFIQRQNKRGLAVGRADIRNDAIDFTYRDEKWTFPTIRVYQYCRPDGSFYLAKAKILRALAKQH